MDTPFLSHTGGKKRSIPFRRQRMQIEGLTPPSSTSAYPVSQPDDPYIADLLQLADGRFVFFCDRRTVSLQETVAPFLDGCAECRCRVWMPVFLLLL